MNRRQLTTWLSALIPTALVTPTVLAQPKESLEDALYSAVHKWAKDNALTADTFSMSRARDRSTVMRWYEHPPGNIRFEFINGNSLP